MLLNTIYFLNTIYYFLNTIYVYMATFPKFILPWLLSWTPDPDGLLLHLTAPLRCLKLVSKLTCPTLHFWSSFQKLHHSWLSPSRLMATLPILSSQKLWSYPLWFFFSYTPSLIWQGILLSLLSEYIQNLPISTISTSTTICRATVISTCIVTKVFWLVSLLSLPSCQGWSF